ncbi:MAG: hypothetical protein M9924_12320 [Rhizobiaceae bacterium]|nr:hypothetical protein [Rhizobiaceae bacterium]
MLKLLGTVALLVVATGQAQAITRYQTMSMTCAQVQAALKRDGVAILRWQSKRTPGLPLYGRYVSDGRYCDRGEVIDLDSVPTADKRSCTVKQCVRSDNDERLWLYAP